MIMYIEHDHFKLVHASWIPLWEFKFYKTWFSICLLRFYIEIWL